MSSEATESAAGTAPAAQKLFRRTDWISCAITTLVVLFGYVWTLAPDLTLEDCGELAVGAYYAGVPHPPGYPVWTICSWLFTVLIPISNIAFRVALFSAVTGAASAGLLALMVSRGSSMLIEGIDMFKGIDRAIENRICAVVGFVAGAMLAFNGFMWSQSVIVEVYTFSTFSFTAMLVYFMLWVHSPDKKRYLYIAFFLFGICFTNHQTLIVASMGLQVVIAMRRPKLGRDLFLANSLLFMVGLVAKSQGKLSSLSTNKALFIIYLVVGLGSLIAWAVLAYRTMKPEDWRVLTVDLLFFVGVGYLFLMIFVAGGVVGSVPGLLHALGLGAWGGFVFLTWESAIGKERGNLELFRNVAVGGLAVYAMLLMTGAGSRNSFINSSPSGFVVLNLLGVFAVVALAVLTSKIHPFGKVLFPLSGMAGLWIAGSSFYFYMPIASMTNPPMNWGYPRMIGGFVHALTRGQYEQTQPTDSIGRLIDQIVNLFIDGAREEFTLVFLCIGLVPFLFYSQMKQREKSWILGLGSIFLCLSILLLMLLNPGTDQQSRDLTKVFFTPSHLIIAMGIGYGLALISALVATRLDEFRPLLLVGAGVAAGVALFEMVVKYELNRYALIQFAYAFVLMIAVGTFAVLYFSKNGKLGGIPVVQAMLVLFASAPVFSVAAHWADNEQRGHLFGYWFGHDMFKPPFDIYPEMEQNAILYGGTDPGRFCPTYMIFCESFLPPSKRRDPDFDRRDVRIITQNALADGTYLQYIRAHYNRSAQIDDPFFQELFRSVEERESNTRTNVIARAVAPLDRIFTSIGAKIEKKRFDEGVYPAEEIHISTPEQFDIAFESYVSDVHRRYQLGQLQPGEESIITQMADGTVTVGGQLLVMSINGILTKQIFDANEDHEFYIEESFPLEWMKPYLTPYGIIMKLNRRPVEEYTEEMVDKDHRFWSRYSERLVGDWIDYDTPITDIVEFATGTYIQKDFDNFPGDPKFARDKQAQKSFAKLRSGIAGLYDWRWRNTQSEELQARYLKEAEFAYKQSLAFYPSNPEAVARYCQLLVSLGRTKEALLITQMVLLLDPNNDMAAGLNQQLTGIDASAPQMEALRAEVEVMAEVHRTNPNDLTNSLRLVNSYFQLGDSTRGLAVLDSILTNSTAGVDVLLSLASVFQQLKDVDRLERSLIRVSELIPENPEVWYDLAAIQTQMGKLRPALTALENSMRFNDARLAADPNAVNLRDNLAVDARFNGLKQLPGYEEAISQGN